MIFGLFRKKFFYVLSISYNIYKFGQIYVQDKNWNKKILVICNLKMNRLVWPKYLVILCSHSVRRLIKFMKKSIIINTKVGWFKSPHTDLFVQCVWWMRPLSDRGGHWTLHRIRFIYFFNNLLWNHHWTDPGCPSFMLGISTYISIWSPQLN